MRKLWKFAVVGAAALALLVMGAQGSVPAAKASEQTVTVYWNMNTPVNGGDETPQFIGGVAIPCFDCYVTSATPDLEVDSDPGPGQTWIHADYTSAPPARLHHMVSFNHNRVDATCANSSPFNVLGDRWLASGDERGTLTFPAGYGYYIPPQYLPTPPNPPNTVDPNNYWNAQIMVHNFSINPQTFRVRMDFKYYPASDHLKDVKHLWLDVNNCSVSTYETPQGYFDYHWTWTDGSGPGTADDVEGKVLEIGGHVHDLGVSVAATKGTSPTSPVIGCPSVGGYATGSTWNPPTISSPDAPAAAHPADNMDLAGDAGYQGHIESMTGCLTNATIAVGDAIQLHSQYNAIAGVCDGTPGDNPSVPPDGPGVSGCIDDVMGIMGAWVYDNCPNVSNPTQDDVLETGWTGAPGADDYGDACDADKDGDGLCDTANVQGPGGYTCTGNDLDDDGDGFPDAAESGTPLCGNGVNDDSPDDAVIDDGCPGGPPQAGVFSEAQFNIGTSSVARCGTGTAPGTSASWPADFISSGVPNSTDKVNILDLTSFLAPTRKLDTSPGDANFDMRWDLLPGKGLFAKWIGINDLTSLLAGSSGFPPMFGSTKSFGGPVCTGS